MSDESVEVKLARLDEKLDYVLRDIKELKDGTAKRISDLEKEVKDMREEMDEIKMSKTRSNVAMGIYISIGVFLAGLMIYHILGK